MHSGTRGPRRLQPRLVLGVALALAAAPARPDPAPGLAVDVPTTAAVTASALALWGATELARGALAPGSCRWCEPPAFDRRARAAVVWSDPRAAGRLSDALVVALPLSLAGVDLVLAGGEVRRASEDVLASVEAIAVAAVAAQAFKLGFARRRPAAWAAGMRTTADDDRAFLSGHVATAFAAAGAFGTVARLRGHPRWPLVYGIGFTVAAGIGYLRMAADEHWLSDVVAAAAVGTAIGIGLPLLLHEGGEERSAVVTPLAGVSPGLALTGTF